MCCLSKLGSPQETYVDQGGQGRIWLRCGILVAREKAEVGPKTSARELVPAWPAGLLEDLARPLRIKHLFEDSVC